MEERMQDQNIKECFHKIERFWKNPSCHREAVNCTCQHLIDKHLKIQDHEIISKQNLVECWNHGYEKVFMETINSIEHFEEIQAEIHKIITEKKHQCEAMIEEIQFDMINTLIMQNGEDKIERISMKKLKNQRFEKLTCAEIYSISALKNIEFCSFHNRYRQKIQHIDNQFSNFIKINKEIPIEKFLQKKLKLENQNEPITDSSPKAKLSQIKSTSIHEEQYLKLKDSLLQKNMMIQRYEEMIRRYEEEKKDFQRIIDEQIIRQINSQKVKDQLLQKNMMIRRYEEEKKQFQRVIEEQIKRQIHFQKQKEELQNKVMQLQFLNGSQKTGDKKILTERAQVKKQSMVIIDLDGEDENVNQNSSDLNKNNEKIQEDESNEIDEELNINQNGSANYVQFFKQRQKQSYRKTVSVGVKMLSIRNNPNFKEEKDIVMKISYGKQMTKEEKLDKKLMSRYRSIVRNITTNTFRIIVYYLFENKKIQFYKLQKDEKDLLRALLPRYAKYLDVKKKSIFNIVMRSIYVNSEQGISTKEVFEVYHDLMQLLVQKIKNKQKKHSKL